MDLRKRLNKSYLLEVWVFTLTLMPVYLFIIYVLLPSSELPKNLIEFAIILFITGGYLSIPTLLMNMLIFYMVSSRLKSALMIKIFHIIISVAGILVTYLWLPDSSLLNPGKNLYQYSTAMLLAVISSSLLFRVFKKIP